MQSQVLRSCRGPLNPKPARQDWQLVLSKTQPYTEMASLTTCFHLYPCSSTITCLDIHAVKLFLESWQP